MSEFIVNLYEFRVTAVADHITKAIKFGDSAFNSIEVARTLLNDLKDKVTPVSVKQKGKWAATRQSMFLHQPTSDPSKGVFFGLVEVGSTGSFTRLRHANGQKPYDLKAGDLSMRDFFFRIEMPSDSALGFLVVQRIGRNTAANAMQQALRQKFFSRDRNIHFRLVTDEEAFNKYLTGRVTAVKATYVPHEKEARRVIKDSAVLGSPLSEGREDMNIKLKVDRKITAVVKAQIKAWLTTDAGTRPQIVTLPVTDEADKIVLCVETDDGNQKQLHPGMIEDMAMRGSDGERYPHRGCDRPLFRECCDRKALRRKSTGTNELRCIMESATGLEYIIADHFKPYRVATNSNRLEIPHVLFVAFLPLAGATAIAIFAIRLLRRTPVF